MWKEILGNLDSENEEISDEFYSKIISIFNNFVRIIQPTKQLPPSNIKTKTNDLIKHQIVVENVPLSL